MITNIWLAFLTGLTSGGISCLAVQGGLLTSAINPKYNKTNQIILFLAAKILAYTLLGALLGQLGVLFTFSPKITLFLQILVGIYMLATAARLVNLHPIFRNLVIQLPSSFYRELKISTKNQSFFAPLVLGFGTILLPCGVTQAMMIYSATSGSLINGALTMLAFTLGTSPLFFAMGLTLSQLFKKKIISYLAAVIIFVLGLISINNGLNLAGFTFTFQNIINRQNQNNLDMAKRINGYQEASIEVTNNGYRTLSGNLKVGIPVKLTIIANNVYSCARSFTIPNYNISIILPTTGSQTVEFIPQKTGKLVYTCSMGMYTGFLNIVK